MNGMVSVKVTSAARELLRGSKAEGQTYSDVIEDRLNKTVSEGSGGKTEGIIYLSTTGQTFEADPFNIQTLTRMIENPHIARNLNLNNVLYFPSTLKAEGFNPDGQLDEEVTKDIQNMLGVAGCAIGEKVKQAKFDTDCYGISIYNPVWQVINGKDILVSLRHLPAWSFCRAPDGYDKTYSFLLPGITINQQTGEVEYWQVQEDGAAVQIKNVMTVKNPRDEGLAGDSKLSPLYDYINMIKFGWNVELQAISRAGAPIFFLKITKPKKATDQGAGGISDIELGHRIIASWSTAKQHLLRENMEIVPLPVTQKIDVLSAIEKIEDTIDHYFNLTDDIKSDGNGVGGSDLSELKLLNRAIQGAHSWLIPPFEALVNEYFTRNGFPEGWHVKLSYDFWESDDREIRIKQVQTGLTGCAIDLADIRAKLDFDPADEDKIKSIIAYNKLINSYTKSSTGENDPNNDDSNNEPSTVSGGKKPDNTKGKKEPRKKTGSGAILNKASNQGNSIELDELARALYEDLSADFDTLINNLSKTLTR